MKNYQKLFKLYKYIKINLFLMYTISQIKIILNYVPIQICFVSFHD